MTLRRSRQRSDIVVTIPAHNEAGTLDACLASIHDAVVDGQSHDALASVFTVVTAHACNDDTIDIARTWIGTQLDGLVVVLDRRADVGLVRHLGVRVALAAGMPVSQSPGWVFSTDADTVVPRDWFSATLAAAAAVDAHCVVGLAGIDRWRGSNEARARYQAIIDAKMGDHTHGHVYGANLAIRADAYRAVGGFPTSGHGEDQRLVDALAISGYRVLRSTEIEVTTSGRTVGRAPDGLSALLERLEVDEGPIPHNRRNEEIAQ